MDFRKLAEDKLERECDAADDNDIDCEFDRSSFKQGAQPWMQMALEMAKALEHYRATPIFIRGVESDSSIERVFIASETLNKFQKYLES